MVGWRYWGRDDYSGQRGADPHAGPRPPPPPGGRGDPAFYTSSSAAPQFGHSSPGKTDTSVSQIGQSTSIDVTAVSSSSSSSIASGTAPRSIAGDPQFRHR